MKADAKKIKIIDKQLKKIAKAEKKLTDHKEHNILKKKVNPYINKIEDKIPEKLQSTLESVFKKGFQLIFEKGTDIIEKSFNKDKINSLFISSHFPKLKNFHFWEMDIYSITSQIHQ